ncbi:MAG TPA: DUF6443 domain-containing protein [Niastella sp.]
MTKGLTDMYSTTYANVVWNSEGTGTVRILNQNLVVVASLTVNISNTAPLSGGSISNTSQTINYNTVPATINASEASGGPCSPFDYQYQWQYAADNANFTDIAGATGLSYAPGALTGTTYFRRKITCAGSVAYTNTAVVNVFPAIQPGSVSPSSQTINYNSSTTLAISGVGGGNGTYTYQWQLSEDANAFLDINYSTASTYTTYNLQSPVVYYRVVVTSNGAVAYSPIATVNVYPQLQGGSVNSKSIAYNSTAGTLTVNGVSGGNSSYTYQWQTSADGNNFSNINGATGGSYAPGNLTTTSYYRVQVTSNGVTVYSGVGTITVMPPLTPGSINGNKGPIGYNSSPGQLTGSIPTGGVCSSYSYQWQQSTDGTVYTDIAGATGQNYTPDYLTIGTYFRRKVTCVPEEQYSNVLLVQVNPPVFPGSISPGHLVIAAGASPGILTANAASGGSCSSYTYQWQQSMDGTVYTDISGATSQNYTPGNLSATTYYRRRVVCGTETAYTNVSTIAIGTIVSSNLNYIRTRELTRPGITTSTDAQSLTDVADVKQTTQYFDGLGRLMQTVGRQQSPLKNDIVMPVVYDPFGLTVTKYLPYVAAATDGEYKPNAIAEQNNFNAIRFQGEQFYYGQTDFELSPLNRVQKNYAPGQNWVGSSRGEERKYWFNTAIDEVRIWNATVPTVIAGNQVTGEDLVINKHQPGITRYAATNSVNFVSDAVSSFESSAGDDFVAEVTDVTNVVYTYSTPGIYPANELSKNVIINEHGKQVITFTDKEGKVILKKVQLTAAPDNGLGSGHNGWLCTYYMYDNLGNLRCVIQPKGVELIAGTWQLTEPDVLHEQCFRYEYDLSNRLIIKKVPGAGEVWMVYDAKDRLVMTQDASMRGKGQWLVNLYDNQNRPVQTGLWNSNNDRVYHAGQANTSTIYPFSVDATPGSGYEMLTRTGYDDYSTIPAASGLNENIDNAYTTSAYLNSNYSGFPYPEPVAQSMDTRGLVTWSQTKVLGNINQYLYSVTLYDKKGRAIQVKIKNKTNGTDISTTQYSFSGQPLVMVQKQENAATANPQTHIVVNKIEYDHQGHLLSIKKAITSNINGIVVAKPELEIVHNEYDELGQLKKKYLGKKKDDNNNYTSDAIQELTYDYNIRGWLLGVNRNYLATEGQTNDGVLFGFELGYDNKNNVAGHVFNNAQYNGNITGMLWKSDGDDIRRKYDFTYDAASRLLKGDFVQQNADDHQWNNAKVSYNVQMGDGINPVTAYDANGNIMAMKQWGLQVGSNATNNPIDDLVYSYYNKSNKLSAVEDRATGGTPATGAVGSVLGDFADRNKIGNDYGYDPNGNMVTDLNKKITGTAALDIMSGGAITYNHLNLPEQIAVKGDNNIDKGTITYIYDAAGNKLQKVTFEKDAKVKYKDVDYTSNITTTTNYLGGFVYESKSFSENNLSELGYTDKLQLINQEEGRIRYMPADENAAAHYEYDYFLRDHLGNVRMVLTEEKSKSDIYHAGMEDDSRSFEVQLFGSKVENTAEDKNKLPSPGFDNNNENLKVSKLNGSTEEGRVGPGVILKVMAGDKIKASTYSWYAAASMDNSTNPTLNAIVSNLLGQLGPGITGIAHGTMSGQVTQSVLQPGMENFLNTQNPVTGTPKAYLNWVLFDEEQFKLVEGNYGAVPVTISAGQQKQLLQANSGNEIEMRKNGYLYVFVSNESKGDVYFDDIHIEHIKGPLLEETHYYPFGLTMAGISSRAFGKLENRLKFNKGSELQSGEFADESGLDVYSTFFRSLDPQLGRWWQIDPKPDFALSSYSTMGNNPILYNDPLGDTLPSGKHIYDEGGIEEYETLMNPNYDGYDPNRMIHLTLSERLYILGHMFGLTTPTAHVASKTVWGVNTSKRGFDIEKSLGGNLPNGFKTIDKFKEGVATSIKSIDLNGSSYIGAGKLFGKLKGYIDELIGFAGGVRKGVSVSKGEVTMKAIEVAIKPHNTSLMQWIEIAQSWNYARKNNIEFILRFKK